MLFNRHWHSWLIMKGWLLTQFMASQKNMLEFLWYWLFLIIISENVLMLENNSMTNIFNISFDTWYLITWIVLSSTCFYLLLYIAILLYDTPITFSNVKTVFAKTFWLTAAIFLDWSCSFIIELCLSVLV